MIPQADIGILRKLGHLVSLCSVLSVVFGLWVLAGWMFQAVKHVLPGLVAVQANAALCFVLIGLGLWIASKEQPTVESAWKPVANVAAAAACVVGLLSLLEYGFGWDLGIDQLLFTAGPGHLLGSARPDPIAAFGFFCLGLALLLREAKRSFGRWLGRLLPCVVAIASLFSLLDFVLNPTITHRHISPIISSALFLLSFAVMFTHPESGLGMLVASENVGGTLTRRLFPAVIVVPLVLAWLHWKGQASGLYADWAGLALMTVFTILLLAGLTVWTGFLAERRDWARRQKEEIIASLASIFPSFDDAIIAQTLDGIVTDWNPGAAAIYGYSAQEMIRKSISITIPPDRREEFAANMQRIKEGQHVPRFETTQVGKDGRIIDVVVSISR
ncbi:MAG: PAS domain-containing protein [Terriglobales bacterium]